LCRFLALGYEVVLDSPSEFSATIRAELRR
jgi:hypothetical protein